LKVPPAESNQRTRFRKPLKKDGMRELNRLAAPKRARGYCEALHL
jgi:hypothetical protein